MDESKVKAMLKCGGDLELDTPDIFGLSVRQRLLANQRSDKLSTSAAESAALAVSPANHRSHLQRCIQQRLAAMVLEPSNHTTYTSRLGVQLIAIGDDEAAKIAFGLTAGYTRCNEGHTRYDMDCEECESRQENGGRYVCRVCLSDAALFCKKCVKKEPKRRAPWCQATHDMLHVPDDGWENLPEGALNEQGQDYIQWVKSLQGKYGST
jgi:hypothetical protein